MRATEIWVVIFIFGLLGLSWPILEIFHDHLYPYLLIFWILFVAILAIAANRARPPLP